MEAFIGTILPFGFTYAPTYWSFCNGGSLPVQQNQALYALIGNVYGGNNVNFNVPDLRGRMPMGMGTRPGTTTNFTQGTTTGNNTAQLTLSNMPAHNHSATFAGVATSVSVGNLQTNVTIPVSTAPTGGQMVPGANSTVYLQGMTLDDAGGLGVTLSGPYTTNAPAATTKLGATATTTSSGGGTITPQGSVSIGPNGGGTAFSIQNPVLVLNFCIALNGLWPDRQ